MQRAGRLIAKAKLCGDCVTPEDLARAAWPVAAGKTIAAHTRVVSLVRNRLVVEVEDAVWQRQLTTLRPQILASLEKTLSAGIVTEVEFRIGLPIPRRMPQREYRRLPLIESHADEADSIPNPALRMLYKAARKKETA